MVPPEAHLQPKEERIAYTGLWSMTLSRIWSGRVSLPSDRLVELESLRDLVFRQLCDIEHPRHDLMRSATSQAERRFSCKPHECRRDGRLSMRYRYATPHKSSAVHLRGRPKHWAESINGHASTYEAVVFANERRPIRIDMCQTGAQDAVLEKVPAWCISGSCIIC